MGKTTLKTHDDIIIFLNEAKKNGISMTCRKYGVQRSYYYYWAKRRNKGLRSYTSKFKLKKRKAYKLTAEIRDEILRQKKGNPSLTARKIESNLKTMPDKKFHVSRTTIQTFLNKHNK